MTNLMNATYYNDQYSDILIMTTMTMITTMITLTINFTLISDDVDNDDEKLPFFFNILDM